MKEIRILYRFLFSDNNIVKDSYLWNMIANFLFAFQSVIVLMVLTRVINLNKSGIFTIAYANATLFLLIGKYGVRNYHVSDIRKANSFSDYRLLRLLSVSLMIFTSIVYVFIKYLCNDYTIYKALIVLLVCLYKVPDAIEDLYFGEYQRQGRLDVAGKCMTIRLSISIIVLVGTVVFTHSLLIALIISDIISTIVMVVLLSITKNNFEMSKNGSIEGVLHLLKTCFPLFAGTFLAQYISNAPKYAIDSYMSDEIQACYGFIVMPVFVIGLLSSVIFNPTIHRLAEYWEAKKIDKFLGRFYKQAGIILSLTALIIGGAWICGIPMLSILYNTNLYAYKFELLILLIGGGFLALANLLMVMLTIMRSLKGILMGYFSVSTIAFVLSDKIVKLYGMSGAVWFYTLLMLMIALVFGMIFARGVKNKIKYINDILNY